MPHVLTRKTCFFFVKNSNFAIFLFFFVNIFYCANENVRFRLNLLQEADVFLVDVYLHEQNQLVTNEISAKRETALPKLSEIATSLKNQSRDE